MRIYARIDGVWHNSHYRGMRRWKLFFRKSHPQGALTLGNMWGVVANVVTGEFVFIETDYGFM